MIDIPKEVQRTIKKYGEGYISDPFYLAKNMNIIVLERELFNTKGFFLVYKRNKIIGINQSLSEEERVSVCAHELGHAVLHSDRNISFYCRKMCNPLSRYEKEADRFAVQLILSKFSKEERANMSNDCVSALTGFPVSYLNTIL